MFASPNTANAAGASHRRKALLGGWAARSRSTGGTSSASVTFHPLDMTPPTPRALASRSRYIALISSGAATNKTMTASSTCTMSTGVPVTACMSGAPACSAPNSSPASTTPSGRPNPSSATVMASMP